MNATDQRTHTTRTAALEARIETLETLVSQLLENDNVLLPRTETMGHALKRLASIITTYESNSKPTVTIIDQLNGYVSPSTT